MEAEFTVDRLAVGGDGIARADDGRVVFVRGALPGERVRAQWVSRGRDFARARATEVLAPSPARVRPWCEWVPLGCGGCGWAHVAPAASPRLKADMVRDALARQGAVRDAVVDVGASVPERHYRTTVRAGVDGHGHLGFRAAASHHVVAVESCGVAHPDVAALLAEVRVSGAHEVILRVGMASGERLVYAPGVADDAVRWYGLDDGVGVGATASIHEVVSGHRFRVSAPSFFQSGPHAATVLVEAVSRAGGEELAGAHRVVDLYSGVGLFGAIVAPQADLVTVERAGSSSADALINLSHRRVEVVTGEVERWTPCRAEVVVADPARAGLGRAAVAVVAATGADVVVLVSCDAAALGRDTALLAAAGYRHQGSTVLDVFPGTPHVEVVTRFERSGPRPA